MTKSPDERPYHQGHHTHRHSGDTKVISPMDEGHLNPVGDASFGCKVVTAFVPKI